MFVSFLGQGGGAVRRLVSESRALPAAALPQAVVTADDQSLLNQSKTFRTNWWDISDPVADTQPSRQVWQRLREPGYMDSRDAHVTIAGLLCRNIPPRCAFLEEEAWKRPFFTFKQLSFYVLINARLLICVSMMWEVCKWMQSAPRPHVSTSEHF